MGLVPLFVNALQGCYKTCFQRYMIQMCHCADASLPNAGAALYNGSFPVCDLANITQSEKFAMFHDSIV